MVVKWWGMDLPVRLQSDLQDRWSCCVHRLYLSIGMHCGLLRMSIHYGEVGLLVVKWLGMDLQVLLYSVLQDRWFCCGRRLNR